MEHFPVSTFLGSVPSPMCLQSIIMESKRTLDVPERSLGGLWDGGCPQDTSRKLIYIHKVAFFVSVCVCEEKMAPSHWSMRFMQVILPVLSLVRIRVLSDHPHVCPEYIICRFVRVQVYRGWIWQRCYCSKQSVCFTSLNKNTGGPLQVKCVLLDSWPKRLFPQPLFKALPAVFVNKQIGVA